MPRQLQPEPEAARRGSAAGTSEGGWDLPTESDAQAAEIIATRPMQPMSSRRSLLYVALAAAAVVIAVVAAVNWRPRPSVGEPPPEMWAAGRDVAAGPWRVRVVDFAWHPAAPEGAESKGAAGASTVETLDVHLVLTNTSPGELSVPRMMLGDRRGRSLAATFGQPVLRSLSGEAVLRVKPGGSADGRLLFPAPQREFCFLVAPDGAEPIPINLSIHDARVKE